MPKSKKPWKILSERSSKHKEFNPKTWAKKMEDKRKLRAVRDRVREEKKRRGDIRRALAEKLKEKLKRKEINQMKSSSYQIVRPFGNINLGVD